MTTSMNMKPNSGLFACHACGFAWSTGEAGTKNHRAACPQYDTLCARTGVVRSPVITAAVLDAIHEKASEIYRTTGRLERIVFLISRSDGGDCQLSTEHGTVEIVSDPWAPTGKAYTLRRCPCGGLMPYGASGDKCALCSWTTKPPPPVCINTSFGPIKITADPTLKPDEFRMEQPDDRVPMNPTNHTSLVAQFEQFKQAKKARVTWLQTTGTVSHMADSSAYALAAREVCPVCLHAMKLTATNGDQACSDPKCKAAHGYPRPGAPGGCCGHARVCDAPRGHLPSCPHHDPAPIDPLDVEYDGVKLRRLLRIDEEARREDGGLGRAGFSAPQRAAVSGHWSAQLRAKVAASTAADKACETSVVVDLEDW